MGRWALRKGWSLANTPEGSAGILAIRAVACVYSFESGQGLHSIGSSYWPTLQGEWLLVYTPEGAVAVYTPE